MTGLGVGARPPQLERDPAAIGGRHRQRGTLRLLSYWAALARMDYGSVFYVGSITDDDGLVACPQGTVYFDATKMTADEAARDALCDYIDRENLGPGKPPRPRPVGLRRL